jgi:hypothetical protein
MSAGAAGVAELAYLRLHALLTAVKHVPITPVARTIRDIQIRGLSLLMMRLEGKSKMTYET